MLETSFAESVADAHARKRRNLRRRIQRMTHMEKKIVQQYSKTFDVKLDHITISVANQRYWTEVLRERVIKVVQNVNHVLKYEGDHRAPDDDSPGLEVPKYRNFAYLRENRPHGNGVSRDPKTLRE